MMVRSIAVLVITSATCLSTATWDAGSAAMAAIDATSPSTVDAAGQPHRPILLASSKSEKSGHKPRIKPSRSNPYSGKKKGSSRRPKHLRRVKQELYVKKKLAGGSQRNKNAKQRRAAAEAHTKRLNRNLKKAGSLSGVHHPDIQRVVKTAKAKKKLLLIVFTSKEPKICRRLESECLGTKYVKDYLKPNYLVHTVDVDRKPGIADYYMFTPLIPHFKVVDSTGTILGESTGYRSSKKLLGWLDRQVPRTKPKPKAKPKPARSGRSGR